MRTVKCKLFEFEVTDKDGRIYSKEALDEACKRYMESDGFHLGGLERISRGAVPLMEVSHSVESLYSEGNSMYGEFKVLDTPNGRILDKMLSCDVVVPTLNFNGSIDSSTNVVHVDSINSIEFVRKEDSMNSDNYITEVCDDE